MRKEALTRGKVPLATGQEPPKPQNRMSLKSVGLAISLCVSSILPVSVPPLPGRHFVVGVSISLNLKKTGREFTTIEAVIIITCRLLRGRLHY